MTSFSVSDEASLQSALSQINGGAPDTYVISVASNFSLPTPLSGLSLGSSQMVEITGPDQFSGSLGDLDLASAGDTFDMSAAAGAVAVGNLSGVSGSALSLGSNTLTADVTGNAVFAGTITGVEGTLVKTGNGTLTLTAENGLAGTIAVDAGTLALDESGSQSWGQLGVTLGIGGATLDLSGTAAGADAVLGSLGGVAGTQLDLGTHTLVLDAGGSFAGIIGGMGGLATAPDGTLRLSGASGFSGGITINGGVNGGVLEIANAQAAGSGTIGFAANADAMLQIDAGDTPDNTISGFTLGDSIVLPGAGLGTVLLNRNTDVLTVTGQLGPQRLQLAGSYAGQDIVAEEDGAGGTILTVIADTAPGITAVAATPASGDFSTGSTIALNASFSQPVFVSGGTPVLLLNNGASAAYTGGSGTGQLSFAYTVAPGQDAASLAAAGIAGASITDGAGLSFTSPATPVPISQGMIGIDTTPPTVSIALFGTAGTTATGTPVFTGTGDADATVTLRDGNGTLGTTTANADGGWSYTANTLSPGPYTITASETDAAGNTGSAALGFIDQSPAGTSGNTGSDGTATVSLTDLSSVQMAALIRQNGLGFLNGTESVQLVDGTLSLGPDTNEAYLQRLYEALLGRSGDPGGLGYYAAQLSAGTASISDIAAQFLASPEYVAQGSVSDAQFVQNTFQQLLGRAPSAGDLAYFTNALGGNTGLRATLVADVANSAESKYHLAADTTEVFAASASGALINDLFQSGLGRNVDTGSLGFYTGELAEGVSPAMLAMQIAASAEFQAVHNGQSNAGYVTGLYDTALGRAPDAGSLQADAAALDAGTMNRAGLLLAISQSPEAAAHLQAAL